MKKRLEYNVNVSYPISLFREEMDETIEKEAKKFKGHCDGSGAGGGYRDISIGFTVLTKAQKFVVHMNSYIINNKKSCVATLSDRAWNGDDWVKY